MADFEYTRPPLYAKQTAAIFAEARYAVIEASTKSGKTHGCIVWFFEQGAQGKAGRNYWWIAPVYNQAKIAYGRLKRAMPRDVFTSNDGEMTLTLANGAILSFKSGEKPDNLYGEDVYAAVIDEASRLREESWHAIRSTVTATQGPVRIIGNVKGRKNWAYRLARKAEAGAADMHYARLTAYDAVEAGVLAAEEVEDARQQLPEAVFRELYLAEPSDDAGNPFGLSAIEKCIAPLQRTPAVVWGWDLAKSVDWTVGIALDRRGFVCGFERWQSPWLETVKRILDCTGTVEALVDSTGVGDPVLEAVQRPMALDPSNAPQLAAFEQRQNFRGHKFTSQSKQQLMEGLAVAIQQQLVRFPDGPVRNELESFEYEYTRTGVRYTAPEGMHDDCVTALALAWEALRGRQSQRPSLALGALGSDLTQRPLWRVS